MKQIDFEKIILEAYGCKDVTEFEKDFIVSMQMIKQICIEVCRQTIKLIAENADFIIFCENLQQKYDISKFEECVKLLENIGSSLGSPSVEQLLKDVKK